LSIWCSNHGDVTCSTAFCMFSVPAQYEEGTYGRVLFAFCFISVTARGSFLAVKFMLQIWINSVSFQIIFFLSLQEL
jgi:hypothetical protein